MIFLSEISKAIAPTLARKLFMMAKEYDNVIDFTIGDPDIITPQPICKAAYDACLNGHTRYSANAGIIDLREAIAKHINSDYNTDYKSENVAVTIGAMEALYISLMCLLNKDDEVIILAPYWIQYENMVRLMGANPIIVDRFTDKEKFEIDLDYLQSVISDKTKAIIINSPNNPSGMVYSSEFLKALSVIAKQNSLVIIADEVYNTLVYDKEFVSVSQFCNPENLILINSFSKSFAMTGWRVGFLAAPAEFTATVVKLQQNIANCVATPAQYAALEAIENFSTYSEEIRTEFLNRRNTAVAELNKIDKIKFNIPNGTFYAFIDVSETGLDSQEFAFSLLREKQVAVVPGVAYGEKFDDYIRLAFTLNQEKLIDGIRRLKEFVDSIRERR